MAHLSTAERIGRKEGREEGREEGKAEGKREYLLEQLAFKFGPLTGNTITGINQMTSDEMHRLAKNILTANSLSELGF